MIAPITHALPFPNGKAEKTVVAPERPTYALEQASRRDGRARGRKGAALAPRRVVQRGR